MSLICFNRPWVPVSGYLAVTSSCSVLPQKKESYVKIFYSVSALFAVFFYYTAKHSNLRLKFGIFVVIINRMTNKHSKYLANLICITLIHIICIFGLAVESSAEVKNKCAIVVNNSIVEKTDVHPSGKKEKAKRFIKDIKKSFSLNLIFRNLSKQEVPQSQMYGGLFTVQSSNRISSWKKSPVTKSLTLGLDLPLYGVKYVGAKSKLKQI